MAEFVRFTQTMWSMIADAKRGDKEAVESILERYRPPLLAFIQNSGFERSDAEDIVQEVFEVVLRDELLAKADRARGKFRSLLLAVVRHTIAGTLRARSRQKRGGGARILSLNTDTDGMSIEQHLAAPEDHEPFDMLWVENVVRLAMSRLSATSKQNDLPYLEALLLLTEEGLDYATIAERLSVKPSDVKNYVFQARRLLKQNVLNEIASYSSSEGEYEAEVAYLMKFLR